MDFVSNIIWNSVEGFVEAGTRTAGGYAGDTLIKAGDMIENYGRGVGNSVENAAAGYGTKISGQTYTPSAPSLSKTPIKKALPSTSAKKPAPKRANSVATSKPSQFKTAAGAARAAKAQGNKAVTGAGSTVGGAAKKTGAAGAVKKAGAGVNIPKKELPKPYPNSIPYPSAKAANTAKPNPRSIGNKEKDGAKERKDNLPKPYPGTTTYQGSDRKAAAKPGQNGESGASKAYPGPKTAVKAGQKGKSVVGDAGLEASKPYPGTNTYPGSEKKTAVKSQKFKPLERHKPPVEKGKVQHITVGS